MKGSFLIFVLLLLSILGASIDSLAATLSVTKIEDTNDSTLNVSNATFTNNRAFDQQCSCGAGGAIWGSDNSSFILSGLVVMGNISPQGLVISGGISVTIQDSVVRQNMNGGIYGDTLS